MRRSLNIFFVALKLGFISFGGPVAHIGYFRDTYVSRLEWLDDATFAKLVALCQILPGPASSQVGMAIGALRGGIWGGLLAWVGFTLPSAIALIFFGFAIDTFNLQDTGWLVGLKIAAAAVVANALWGMSRSLTPDRTRITIAIVAAILLLYERTTITQILVLAAGATIGWRLQLSPINNFKPYQSHYWKLNKIIAAGSIIIFFLLLIVLPILRELYTSQYISLFDSFYRTGSLVFGGGHVVLPLLESEVVAPGWLSKDEFIAGYGAAQAIPGPLFTFAAYIGTVANIEPNGLTGAFIALLAIYLPSFLLLSAILPFWQKFTMGHRVEAAYAGMSAAVIGLWVAAFYNPVWTYAITTTSHFSLWLLATTLLMVWKVPPWLVVLLTAVGGYVLEL